MSSWVVNDPSSLVMGAAGLYIPGLIGQGPGGRITNFSPSVSGRSIGVEVAVDPIHSDWTAGNVMVWLNGVFNSSGGSATYRGTRYYADQGLTLDAYPFPPHETYKVGTEHLLGVQSPALELTWSGDRETSRYEVLHSTSGESGLKRQAIYTANSNITVTNDTANGATLSVLGVDGVSGGGHEYTLTLTKTGETISASAVDSDSARTWSAASSDALVEQFGNAYFQFGVGLSIEIPDPDDWPYSGATVFTVTTTPARTHTLRNAQEASHTFRVDAFRGDGSPAVPSQLELYTQTALPNPVTSTDVTFVSATEVQVSFTMPSDANIDRYHVYHSWPEIDSYDVVWPIPRADNSATPSQAVTVNLTGLIAGKYQLLVRAVNDRGEDDQSDMVVTFYLSATTVSFQDVAPPKMFQAIPNGIGKIKFNFQTNGAEDLVNIYSDNADGTGTIDYTSPWLSISSSDRDEFNRYSKELTNLPSGTYKFGARTSLSGAEEENTSVTDEVTIYGTAVSIPYSLAVAEAS